MFLLIFAPVCHIEQANSWLLSTYGYIVCIVSYRRPNDRNCHIVNVLHGLPSDTANTSSSQWTQLPRRRLGSLTQRLACQRNVLSPKPPLSPLRSPLLRRIWQSVFRPKLSIRQSVNCQPQWIFRVARAVAFLVIQLTRRPTVDRLVRYTLCSKNVHLLILFNNSVKN